MKNVITLLIFCCSLAYGQNETYDFTADLIVDQYQIESEVPGQKAVQIPCGFNTEKLHSMIPDSLDGLSIIRIDLVFTTYRTAEDFDQEGLNNNRMKTFKGEWPGTNDPLIEWRRIGQSQATLREDAAKMFHGFVVYYRPTPTKESIEAELSFIDEFLEMDETSVTEHVSDQATDKKEGTVVRNTHSDSEHEKIERKTTGTKGVSLKMDHESELSVVHGNIHYTKNALSIPFESGDKIRWNQENYVMSGLTYVDNCFLVDCFTMTGTKADYERKRDSLKSADNTAWFHTSKSRRINSKVYKYHFYVSTILEECDSVPESAETISTWSPTYRSKWMDNADYGVVEAVFRRNPDWKNSLVVMDVTGSMSPYIAKTMAWVKATQDSTQVHAFVFFNDGDMTPDRQKKTGRVGGIYSTVNSDFKAVYNKMKLTMQKGGGGDCPENNVEATIKGIQLHPTADEIIMVVDNWATPRDLELVKDIGKPVHVIVCGSFSGVNVKYIQLAIDTGGSIHTIENDLDSRDIKSGESFKVGKFYYALVEGKVVKAEIK